MDYAKSLSELAKRNKGLDFLEEILGDYSELPERTKKQARYFAKTKLKEVLDIAKTLKEADEAEALNTVCNIWFEWRSEWIRYNAVNNYNMVLSGNAEDLSIIKSGYVSNLIGQIEELIPPENLEKMHDIMVKMQY